MGKAYAENTEINNNNGKESSAAKQESEKKSRQESYILKPLIIKGTREKKRKKPDIQSISRQTMTLEDMKDVPASFGDSIGALTSLPGIIHAYGGLFGPLAIRGADPSSNNYFIDDIPMDDPMHFGGLHSVINTNLMKDIDVYSSAFPAEFGSATAAVINISTVDEVNEFGGYTDIGILSASALIKAPILRNKSGGVAVGGPSHNWQEDEEENAGYIIGSGRYGYIALGIKLAELITGDEVPISPEYWDYQFKGKYKINNTNSVSMLLFGHKDYFRFLMTENMHEEGDDPLMSDMKFRTDTLSHSQGLYLDSKFSDSLSNRLIYYQTFPESHMYFDIGSEATGTWAKDVNQYFRPWVFGLKDKAKVKWMNGHSELMGGGEYTYYYFIAKGKFIYPKAGVMPDINNDNSVSVVYRDDVVKNNKIGGFLENKLTFGGFTALPGVRSEYLDRTEQTTFDPRIMTSYKFSTNTTVSAAGGHYSNFMQTNPNFFNIDPALSAIDNDKIVPEKAWHSAIGMEQEVGLYTFKIEGFKNYFYDLAEAYGHTEPDGSWLEGLSTGKMEVYGFEVMIRKDTRENENGLFGWLSYTYTHSKFKSGLPTESGYAGISSNEVGDNYGDKWTTFSFEQRHSLKLVAGYRLGNHMISGKFQFYSGFPYTPIVDADKDTLYTTGDRYVPVYGKQNSKNMPPYYQLDLRYTKKVAHSWGSISWYVEVINAFMNNDYEYIWYWNKDYSSGNNPKMKKESGYNFLPNFGVEVKF